METKKGFITAKELIERKPTWQDFIVDPNKKINMCGIYMPIEEDKHANTFGKWKVSKTGNMEYDKGRYSIEKNRLSEDDWIAHLFSKGWIDWNEFIPAYFQALKNADVQFITSRVFY